MAKKKRSKKTESKGMSVELVGLLFILIGVIGFGFGPVGTIIKEFAMFLMGSWWMIFILSLIFLGICMLFKRKIPKFFSSKLIGFYLILIVVLSLSHLTFLDKSNSFVDIIQNTVNEFMERINTISVSNSILNTGNTTISIGGGILGAIFIASFNLLFGRTGAMIILIVLGITGVFLLFNASFRDMFKKTKKVVKNIKESSFEDEEEEEEIEEKEIVYEEREIEKKEPPKNEVIVASSLEAIKNAKPVVEIEVQEEYKLPEKSGSGVYLLPPINLLKPLKEQKTVVNMSRINKNGDDIIGVLRDFQINNATCVAKNIGPAFTQYEIQVPSGTKVNRILNINKEIALKLAAKDVRIEAPIPGKSTIGIEVPNDVISSVPFREIIGSKKIDRSKGIMVALGKNLMGNAIVEDLTKMPHLLVAGSTGSGKSVCINAMISSILMNYKPDEVQLVLVDPKKVEFTNYKDLPHLRYPVINEPKLASGILQKIVVEMDNRYTLFANTKVKKIEEFNANIEKYNKRFPEKAKRKMPYIVVIIDELADLMLVASKEVEASIMRITQLARAAGIHLVVATQRPSTNVITGVIKANIPSRICFAVASQIDSRTALDMGGAEKLLGKGDMLYLPMGVNIPQRIQGCFISDEEIERLIKHCTNQSSPNFVETHEEMTGGMNSSNGNGIDGEDDPMYDEVVEFAIETGKISASLIQRKFRFGFNRAARMIDLLEARGVVGPQNGSKPREVLIKRDE